MPSNHEAAADLPSWVGRTEIHDDQVTPAPLRGLAATLDRPEPEPNVGTAVPPLWHWLYFLPQHAQSAIGVDGHPRRGGFLPPVPLPRRMWAGGRLRWEAGNPFVVGDMVRRESRIASVKRKSGRSGELVFVQVSHDFSNSRGLALQEEQDIVFRGAAVPGEPAPQPVVAESGAPWQREVRPDEVLLFRYSALTFNGHRIHYDRAYATREECYPGLVVHGPLIATLLADLVRRQLPGAQFMAFDFKAHRPLFDGRPFTLNGAPAEDGRTVRLWTADHEGHLAMRASATLA